LVDEVSQGTFFHYSDWLRICEKNQKAELKLFGFYVNGELVGGCPLYFSNSFGIIKTATTRSITGPYGGLIFNLSRYNLGIRYSMINTIQQKLENEIQNGMFGSITISNSPAMNDIRYFTWNGWKSVILYTYYIDLQTYENPLFITNMERKIKENHIKIEESKDIDSFYALYQATWQRRGHPVPVSKSFIKEIFDAFEKKNRIKMEIAVSITGHIAAANIILIHRNCIYAWLAATDNELWKFGAHYGIYSHIIHKYKKLGYPYFDIMMANTKTLLPFAHGFNPRTVPYYIIEKRGICNSLLHKLSSHKQKNFNEF
jgi:hypothetical protein